MPIHADFLTADFDQQSRLDRSGFWLQPGFISRSVHVRLQVSVCSGYDLCHRGMIQTEWQVKMHTDSILIRWYK